MILKKYFYGIQITNRYIKIFDHGNPHKKGKNLNNLTVISLVKKN